MASATVRRRRPRYGDNQRVKGGVAKRTARRLAAVRLHDPGALKGVSPKGGYTGREARKAKRAASKLPKQPPHRKKRALPGSKFDPLEPLTGETFAKELQAREHLKFDPLEREQHQAEANQAQTAANTSTYYDDWRQALREATARINETNRQNVETTQARTDASYAEDKAAVAARDAAASEQAAKLGRGPVHSEEGARAVEAQRSQQNQRVAGLREQASADTSLMEKRGATAVLAKAQELAKESNRARRLREDRKQLEESRGDFRLDERAKARESERQWAAIEQEFKLNKRKVDIDAKQGRADRALERQKINAQKIVARIYASADKAGARAQVRVAQLQLKKGKISKHQYNTIRNIYEGLPGGGGGGGSKGGGGGGGQWGGRVDTPVENQKADQMYADLISRKPDPSKRQKIIQGAIRNGVPRAAAVKAWRRYMRKRYPHRGSATPRNPDGTPG